MLLALLVSFGTSSAQDLRSQIALPGSINASLGTAGPVEPGNGIGSATFEQGVTVWRRGSVFVVGFVDVTVRADTHGYTWNNTIPYLAGGKVVISGAGGVLQAVVGMAGDTRQGATTRVRRAALLSYWAGWPRSPVDRQFPGSVWATSGLVTASEPGNWITAAHFEQGVSAWRGRGLSLVPFAATTLSMDTEHRAWNNRGFVDAGLKVSTHVNAASIDFGVAQRVTRAWHSGATAAAPVVFVNLWVGWMPRVKR